MEDTIGVSFLCLKRMKQKLRYPIPLPPETFTKNLNGYHFVSIKNEFDFNTRNVIPS